MADETYQLNDIERDIVLSVYGWEYVGHQCVKDSAWGWASERPPIATDQGCVSPTPDYLIACALSLTSESRGNFDPCMRQLATLKLIEHVKTGEGVLFLVEIQDERLHE